MVWVPRGFLHAFCVPLTAKSLALFEYFCDNVYDKNSETGVAPASLLPNVAARISDMVRTSGLSGYGDFISLFTSATEVPLPLAIRFLRLGPIIR